MITKKTNKILWLTAIAMITIFISFACSKKPTESANLSSSGGAGTTITPPTGGGTSSQPALKITDWGAIQFDGLTFKNENHTVNIVVKKLGGNNSQARFELNGKTYGFGSRIYNSQYNPNTFIFGNINNDISDKGYAEFRESGDLLIWFNNNQSDLITLKLVNNTDGEKPETENYLIPQEYWGKYFDKTWDNYNKIYSYYTNSYYMVASNGVYDYTSKYAGGKILPIISLTNYIKNGETAISLKFEEGTEYEYWILNIYRDEEEELKRTIYRGHRHSTGWHWWLTHENDIDKNGILTNVSY